MSDNDLSITHPGLVKMLKIVFNTLRYQRCWKYQTRQRVRVLSVAMNYIQDRYNRRFRTKKSVMKLIWGLMLLIPGVLGQGAIAAEYQGQNIDGRKLPATAYSYETGGTFDIQVKFKDNKATLYFDNGAKQTIRLHDPVISNPKQIGGWGRPFSLSIGGIFNIGFDDRGGGNVEPSSPRPFEGFWNLSLNDTALQSLGEW